jgi:hypothetical protein
MKTILSNFSFWLVDSLPRPAFRGLAFQLFSFLAVFVAGVCPSVLANANADDAGDESNPYRAIMERNAFRLVATPVVLPAASNNPAPQTTIRLTGLLRISGERTHALFARVGKDPKDVVYFNLCESERDGTLELIKILEDQGGAEVIHEGQRETVWLNKGENSPSEPTETPASPVPEVLANVLTASELAGIEDVWPEMSKGQQDAMVEAARTGKPLGLVGGGGPRPKNSRRASAPADLTP